MDEPRKQDRVSPVQADQEGNEAGPRRLTEQGGSLTVSLTGAIENGTIDLRPVVQFLAARVWETERQLARLGRRMERIKRRVSELESELSRVADRSSQQEESIRMMCEVLKELDDPYGFGTSLDERLAYDEADRATEEDG
ncbi:MAG: hypothetical protein ACYC61_04040 [Isosphaeraceae bacterium]